MSITGALAMTGVFFVFAAVVIGVAADNSSRRARRRLAALAWSAFVLAVVFLIAAAWTAALT